MLAVTIGKNRYRSVRNFWELRILWTEVDVRSLGSLPSGVGVVRRSIIRIENALGVLRIGPIEVKSAQ
eukprot:2422476-Pyramimonas_sp.AAC.1